MSGESAETENKNVVQVKPQPNTGLAATWGFEVVIAICEHCAWCFLLARQSLPQRCPHCFQADLALLEDPDGSLASRLAYTRPPEQTLPYTLSASDLEQGVAQFAHGIPFAPPDLQSQNLRKRLKQVYLPAWLVDVRVQASWQAEAGYNYDVVSHEDAYSQNRGGWASREITERKVRWEPRLGRLERSYTNIPAPAMEDDGQWKLSLGEFNLSPAQTYRPETARQAFVRLPDRSPQDAWSSAEPGVQSAAAEECMRATGGDHFRTFQWEPEFSDQNWTLLLQPLYATYYLDDDNQPQPVYFHGQFGGVAGSRRASMRRAQRASLWILAVALVIFALGLVASFAGVAVTPLLALGGVGLGVAAIIGVGAIFPVAIAWQFNRKYRSA
jgi:hypothetical protein